MNRSIFPVFNILLCLTVLFAGVLAPPPPALAQSQNGTVIPFSEIGVTDIVLTGPFDAESVLFSLPDNWQLESGTTVDLYIQVFVSSEQVNSALVDDFVGASLGIYYNGELQQSISLINSEETTYYRVPIRVQDLATRDADGRIEIYFLLDAGIDCNYGFHKTTVKISPESSVNIVHSEKTPSLDLRDLPRPIYKKDSYFPDTAKIIIPKSATAEELRAAYLVAAAMGKMTNRRLDLEMMTNEMLNQSIQADANLIFVGKVSSIPVLSQMQLAVSVTSGKFTSQVLQADDGIVQMIVSPWNPSKVILVVSANTDIGVVRAAQALTTGSIQTSIDPAVSFVAQISPSFEGQASQQNGSGTTSVFDYTLAELGYSAGQVGSAQTGVGTQWFGYDFTVPNGLLASEEAFFDLIFSYSSLIDPARSEISVYINGVLAGSIGLDLEKTSYVKKRIEIAPTLIRPGQNRIDFAADLFPLDICATINLNGLWMTVYPESSIHLNLRAPRTEQTQVLELRNYPYTFLAQPSMSDLTIVLSQKDPSSWIAFGNVIYDLGGRALGEVMSFDVSFSDSLSELQKQNNLIFFGIPTALHWDESLNAVLPAPFEDNSNVAVLDNQTVIYRIEANKSLGYLELFTSPWNDEKTVLAILGTNHEGLTSSAQTLLDSKSRNGMKGNFATIDGSRFVVVDTRSGLGLGSFPVSMGSEFIETVVAPTPEIGKQNDIPSFDSTRRLILVVLAVVIVAMLLLVIFLVLSRNRKKATNQ